MGKIRQLREFEKQRYWEDPNQQVCTQFESNPDLITLRKKYVKPFFQAFQKGYLNFRAGEWDVARTALTDSQTMLGAGHVDGPSVTLLEYMRITGNQPPKGWAGI